MSAPIVHRRKIMPDLQVPPRLKKLNPVKFRYCDLLLAAAERAALQRLLGLCRFRMSRTFRVFYVFCVVLFVFADFFRPACDLGRGWCVVRPTDVGEQSQWQTDGQNGCGGEQNELPVAFELQMHKKHHDAKRFGDRDRHHEDDRDRLAPLDDVENHRQRCADTQNEKDRQIIDVMRSVSMVIRVSNVAGMSVVRHRRTQSKNQ